MNLLLIYRFASILLGPLIICFLARRQQLGKEHPLRYLERRGQAGVARPAGKLIWLHAASVGEATSSMVLIDALLAYDRHLHILITTGTVTSAALLEKRLPERAIHQFIPVDRPGWVRRFLTHWKPDMVLWFESELWPNLIQAINRRAIPLILVNGRMSDKSYRKWQKYAGPVSKLLGCFDLCLVQSAQDKERYAFLGAKNLQCPGNIKMASPPLAADVDQLARLRQNCAGRPLWLAASTHAGEEVMVAGVHRQLMGKYPDLLTIIVPRHSERGALIAREIESTGLRVQRRIASEKQDIQPETQIYIADTMGELGLFYRLSQIVFIGGSFAKGIGGHNPIEAAQLDCAILWGPDMSNFREIILQLNRAGAGRALPSWPAVADQVERLLSDKDDLQKEIVAGRSFASSGESVRDDILEALVPWMNLAQQKMSAR